MHQPHNPDRTPDQAPNDSSETRLCRHVIEVSDSGEPRPCGSPALRGQYFCYYHHPTRKPASNPQARRERRLARKPLRFPLPTTRAELQYANLYLMHLIATNGIDTRRAGLLLLALQNTTKTLDG